jgi:outer membrane protein assembly factor BamB
MRSTAIIIAPLISGALLSTPLHAQFGRGVGDFSTTGADAQRSSWVRNDAKISRESMQKPGFQFLWKVKLANEARQLNALTPASLLTGYIGYRGFRSLGYVGGSADKVFALDTDLGRVEWQKGLTSAPGQQGPSATCPGGMSAMIVRPVSAAFPVAGAAGGRGGRGTAAKSGVGEPGEGAVTLKEIEARNAQAQANQPGRGGRGPDFRRMPNYIHAISSDGMFHSMYVSNGEEPEPPIKFLPPNANAQGLIVIDNVAYVATTDGCGGAANAVWALDIASKQVATWQLPSGGIAGTAGPAFGEDGTVYVATTTGDLAALESKTLKLKEVFKAGQEFTSSPVVFQHNDKTMIAAATKDGRIHVVGAGALAGSSTQSSVLSTSPEFRPGALASWQDAGGTRYILAPSSGAVVALKMMDKNGTPALETAWTSRDMASPMTPLVINGVVFAATPGQRSTPAVMYALDGASGKELWNSGKTITSFTHNGGVSAGGSQVYLGTHDGTLYVFGYGIEH